MCLVSIKTININSKEIFDKPFLEYLTDKMVFVGVVVVVVIVAPAAVVVELALVLVRNPFLE